MQRAPEHLTERYIWQTKSGTELDEPSLIAFPGSLSTTTPQKNTRLVVEAVLEVEPGCCSQSSPEAKGTAFLGEALETINPNQRQRKDQWRGESNARPC
jgi:hypothetical protein